MTPTERAAKNYGTDLWLPDDPDAPLRVTVTGDILLVSGVQNAERALARRVLTGAGGLTHRPTYGVGLTDFVSLPNTPTLRAKIANATRRNALDDDRVADVAVSVTTANTAFTSATGQDAIVVSMSVKWSQEDTSNVSVRT